MSDTVVTASPAACLAEIVDLMMHHRVKRIPIVDNGRVIGSSDRRSMDTPEHHCRNCEAEMGRQALMINVMVDKGVAKLSGAIFDERERQSAIVAAENVAGVRFVEDNLFCADPVSVILVSQSSCFGSAKVCPDRLAPSLAQ